MVSQEITYQSYKVKARTVGEDNPLPVALWPPQGQNTHDDYFELAYNAAGPVEYNIGTGANKAFPKIPLFTALNTSLFASVDCWVWFNFTQNVRHRLIAGRYYNYALIPIKKIFVLGVAAAGLLVIDVEGAEE